MFRGMEYVYEVYREKSFSGAAQKLFISQPALSNSIKRIEERIGAQLFDRSTSPVQLTDVGEKYIQAVEQIRLAQEEFGHYLADTQNLKAGRLVIGSGALISSYILPELIAGYQERFPYVEVNIVEGGTVTLQKMLSEGAIDLLVENHPLSDPLLEKLPFRSEHTILAAPKSWPINDELLSWQLSIDNIISRSYLARQYPVVPLDRFRDAPFLFLTAQEGDARQKALNLCRSYGFEPQIALTLTQQLTAYNMTCAGLGLSFVSDTLVESTLPHPNVVFYKLDAACSEQTICFYYKKNRYVPKCMTAFLDFCREHRRIEPSA